MINITLVAVLNAPGIMMPDKEEFTE